MKHVKCKKQSIMLLVSAMLLTHSPALAESCTEDLRTVTQAVLELAEADRLDRIEDLAARSRLCVSSTYPNIMQRRKEKLLHARREVRAIRDHSDSIQERIDQGIRKALARMRQARRAFAETAQYCDPKQRQSDEELLVRLDSEIARLKAALADCE